MAPSIRATAEPPSIGHCSGWIRASRAVTWTISGAVVSSTHFQLAKAFEHQQRVAAAPSAPAGVPMRTGRGHSLRLRASVGRARDGAQVTYAKRGSRPRHGQKVSSASNGRLCRSLATPSGRGRARSTRRRHECAGCDSIAIEVTSTAHSSTTAMSRRTRRVDRG